MEYILEVQTQPCFPYDCTSPHSDESRCVESCNIHLKLSESANRFSLSTNQEYGLVLFFFSVSTHLWLMGFLPFPFRRQNKKFNKTGTASKMSCFPQIRRLSIHLDQTRWNESFAAGHPCLSGEEVQSPSFISSLQFDMLVSLFLVGLIRLASPPSPP